MTYDEYPDRDWREWLDHEPLLARVVRDIVPAEDVADVLQSTWLAALRGPGPSSRSRRGWLLRVARNFAYEHLRTEANRRAREAAEGGVEPEEERRRAELVERVLHELAALEEPYRGALRMRYLDGLSYAAMAQALGMHEPAIRKRVQRGLARIRERIAGPRGHGGDHGPRTAGLAVAIAAWWRGGVEQLRRRAGPARLLLGLVGTVTTLGIALAVEPLDGPDEAGALAGAALRGAPERTVRAVDAPHPTRPGRVVARPTTPVAGRDDRRDESLSETGPVGTGRVVGPRGLPVSGDRLLRSDSGRPVGADAAGRFTVPAEATELRAVPPWVEAYSSISAEAPWANEAIEHLVVLATRARVSGTVRDAKGAPMAGVDVNVFVDPAAGLDLVLPRTVPWQPRSVRTDAVGEFRLDGVPWELARARVEHPCGASRELVLSECAALVDGEARLDVRLGRAADDTPHRTWIERVLSGRVLGVPDEVRTEARVHAAGRVAACSPDGTYRLDLPAGWNGGRVAVSAPGRATAVSVLAPDAALDGRDWTLEPARAIAGRAFGPTGEPWRDAWVIPWGEAWVHERWTATDLAQPRDAAASYFGLSKRAVARTDEWGRFVMGGLRSGAHRLAFVAPDLSLLHVTEPILTDVELVRVDVRVPADAWRTVRGRLLDRAGRPLPDAAIQVGYQVSHHVQTDVWRVGPSSVVTDADGCFEARVPRACRVSLMRCDPPRLYAPVYVESGGDAWVELAAPALRYFRVELTPALADVESARVLDAYGSILPVMEVYQSRFLTTTSEVRFVDGVSAVLATVDGAVSLRLESDPPVELGIDLAPDAVTTIRG